MTKKHEKFTCANCDRTFTSTWSDEEALAEAKAEFGEIAPDDRASLCDDCYRDFMTWYRNSKHGTA